MFESLPATPVTELALSETPELRNPTLSDAQRVEMIRHWVAQQVDIAKSTSTDCLSHPACRDPFYQIDISKRIEAFRENKAAVLCAGAADTLKMVYDAFGYKSVTLFIGSTGNFTHAVTLVQIPQGDQTHWVVQDPMLDTGYRAPDGHLLGYFEMISFLKQGQTDQIIPTNPDGIVRDRNFGPALPNQEAQIVKMQMNIQENVAENDQAVDTVKAAGCPADITYLYALPFEIYWATPEEAEAMKTKAKTILGDQPCDAS